MYHYHPPELSPLSSPQSAIGPGTVVGLQALIRPQVPVHLAQTLGSLRRGLADPTFRVTSQEAGAERVWVCTRTAALQLPVLLCFDRHPTADYIPDQVLPALHRSLLRPVRVRAWAHLPEPLAHQQPDAYRDLQALATTLPGWLGLADDWKPFISSPSYALLPQKLKQAHRAHPGLRLSASNQLDRHVFVAIMEQRVTQKQAFESLRQIATRYGEASPVSGQSDQPPRMHVYPTARTLGKIPDWQWHCTGVDAARYRAVREYARNVRALHRIAAEGQVAQLAAVLGRLRGVGPWTVAEVLQNQCGHPDAVSLCDYHLSHHVGHALAGHRVDDAQMVQLLAPYAGHRQRVIRLIAVAGATEPRRAARMAVQDYRDM